jgi:hypothetical protein
VIHAPVLFGGHYEDALEHIDAVDAVIVDPPYGARTHDGNADRVESMGRSAIAFRPWSPDDVFAFVDTRYMEASLSRLVRRHDLG